MFWAARIDLRRARYAAAAQSSQGMRPRRRTVSCAGRLVSVMGLMTSDARQGLRRSLPPPISHRHSSCHHHADTTIDVEEKIENRSRPTHVPRPLRAVGRHEHMLPHERVDCCQILSCCCYRCRSQLTSPVGVISRLELHSDFYASRAKRMERES